jgi:hypothetical protein
MEGQTIAATRGATGLAVFSSYRGDGGARLSRDAAPHAAIHERRMKSE